MADISDVEQAIANTVTSVRYPHGGSQASAIGPLCRVYRGWPSPATLNADLGVGILNVTVTSDNDAGRITTRYLLDWQTSLSLTGITAASGDGSISMVGRPALGDVVGALIDGRPYAYRIQPGDTLDLVASNLAQLIQAHYIAIAAGPNITIPEAHSVRVKVVCDQGAFSESRRQEKDVRIIFWCPNPLVRDAAVAAVDTALNALAFILLPDNTTARIVYRNTASYDQAQNALLYRRDLVYTAEYPTVTTLQLPSMLFGASGANAGITYT